MARVHNRLTAKGVKDAKGPSMLNDGGGLYLQVTPAGSKSWLFRFRWQGKRPQLGLGAYPAVSLADARRKAEEARSFLNEKPSRNPRHVWASQKESPAAKTFGQFSETFLERILDSFRNEKHRYQWQQSLKTYAAPIWGQDIAGIDTSDVLKCLEPIWTTKNETAKRLRGRLERVFDAARAEGLRSGENPARWRGHLQAILPDVKRVVAHQAAIPYQDIPCLMADLTASAANAATVLRFIVLTGARSTEGRAAKWTEIDLNQSLWVLPAERMKGFRKHTVPLNDPAMEILRQAAETRTGDYVFPGQTPGKPLSETATRKLLRQVYPHKINDRWPTVHGFRSAFRDWAGDCTSFSREVAEMAIAHVVGGQVERSYRRGDALEKRRALMNAWADYCMGGGADVVQLHG